MSHAFQQSSPRDAVDWDGRVSAFEGAGVFHSPAWARVLHEAYGVRVEGFTLLDGSEPLAMMPVADIHSRFTGRRGVCLPFADECAPLVQSGADVAEILNQVLEVGKGSGWRFLEWRGGADGFEGAEPSVEYVGHTLDLTPGESVLQASLPEANRRAIRKAGRSPLNVSVSADPQAMEDYYRLHCVTRRRHGLPPQPLRFFRAIQRELLGRGCGCVVLARRFGRAVAGAVFLFWNGRAVYKFGASDETGRRLRANNLVMWEGIRALAARGIRALSFGRTSLAHEGLRRFKRGWGCRGYRIPYFRFDFSKNAYVTGTDRVSGWYNRVFRALPVSASRAIGAVLYPHLA